MIDIDKLEKLYEFNVGPIVYYGGADLSGVNATFTKIICHATVGTIRVWKC